MYKRLFGAYREKDLPIYRLHPMAKLIFSLTFVISAGFISGSLPLAFLFALFIISGYLCGISVFSLWQLFRPFMFLLAFSFVIQLFLTSEGHWAMPNPDTAGNAAFFTLRLAIMIGFSSLFAIITPPVDIVKVFYFFFKPLKIIRIAPEDASLSMLIALRFIPLLFTEGEKIVDSQRLKGILPYKDEKGSKWQLIKGSASLVVPLFVRTFYYASQIAITLQYRRQESSFFRMKRPALADYAAAFLFMAVGAGVVFFGKIS